MLKTEVPELETLEQKLFENLEDSPEMESLKDWSGLVNRYEQEDFVYQVRGKEVRQPLLSKTLSGVEVPRVSPPQISDWGDRYKFLRKENFPGFFPYTAGVFPLKRKGEDPGRQFAGELSLIHI